MLLGCMKAKMLLGVYGGLNTNKLAKLGDAIAISNLKLSFTDPLTDRDRC